MPRSLLPGCALLLLTAGCAPIKDAPSLSPRAAEAIDPRLPVPDRSAALPVSPEFATALTTLRTRALAAAAEAEPAIRAATAAAAAADPPQSESWIAAQQIVSAAVAARAPFAAALGDLDALIGLRVRGRERLVPQDVAAAEAVLAELNAIDRRQAGAIMAAERRLQP